VIKKTENDWIVIGRFGKVHGIKGLISVISFTDPIENIFEYEPLHILLKKVWCPLKLANKQFSGDRLLVQVENYLTREDAAFLTNIEIAVPRQVLPSLEDNQYYLHDLIGLNAFNLRNELLGTISEIIPTGSNDVIVISGEKRILVPFVWDVYVKSIHLSEQKIFLDWDEDELGI